MVIGVVSCYISTYGFYVCLCLSWWFFPERIVGSCHGAWRTEDVKKGPPVDEFFVTSNYEHLWTCQLKCPNSQTIFHHFPKHRDVQACLRKYCAVKTRNGWKRIADPLDQHPSLWPVSSQLFFLLLIPCSLHLFQESSPSIGCLVPENWRNPWIWSLQHLREANSTRERLPSPCWLPHISVSLNVVKLQAPYLLVIQHIYWKLPCLIGTGNHL